MSHRNFLLMPVGVLLSLTAAHAQQDTCKDGFVWREAFPGDHVCVSPATRSQAAADNRQAAARRAQGGGPSGPDTCRQGYVWREARPADHVCVTVETRAQASADNRQASSRIAAGKGGEARRICTLYEHRDYGGAHYGLRNGDVLYMVRDPDPNTGTSDAIHRFIYEPSWNDKVSSFKVEGGCTLTLWEHVNHGGHHFTSNKSYRYVGDGWNDKASQADCACPGLPNW